MPALPAPRFGVQKVVAINKDFYGLTVGDTMSPSSDEDVIHLGAEGPACASGISAFESADVRLMTEN